MTRRASKPCAWPSTGCRSRSSSRRRARRTLSVDEIARRLDDRFQVLADPTSRKQERRRALRATIGWSYDLLFPDDQKGLWALATFAGGAPLDAIELVIVALGVPRAAALDVVDRLVNRSLVIVDADRYRLLDSIRAFAIEATDDADVAADAHSRWLADLAATSTEGVRSADQADYLAVARAERANIDAALAWCATHDPDARAADRDRVRVGVDRARRQSWRRPVAGRHREHRWAPPHGVDRSVDRRPRRRP